MSKDNKGPTLKVAEFRASRVRSAGRLLAGGDEAGAQRCLAEIGVDAPRDKDVLKRLLVQLARETCGAAMAALLGVDRE